MAGILSTGRGHLNEAIAGGNKLVGMEQQRNAANKQLKQAEGQQTMSMAASGAGVGAKVGGPVGAVAGLVIGTVLGEIF